MNRYCFNCERMVNASVGLFIEEYPVKGEATSIRANVVVCSVCGVRLWDNEYDNQNLVTAYNQYRSNHGLLMPDEIQDLRVGNALQPSDFDKILGFKSGSIAKFEHGTLQTKEQDDRMRDYDQRCF